MSSSIDSTTTEAAGASLTQAARTHSHPRITTIAVEFSGSKKTIPHHMLEGTSPMSSTGTSSWAASPSGGVSSRVQSASHAAEGLFPSASGAAGSSSTASGILFARGSRVSSTRSTDRDGERKGVEAGDFEGREVEVEGEDDEEEGDLYIVPRSSVGAEDDGNHPVVHVQTLRMTTSFGEAPRRPYVGNSSNVSPASSAAAGAGAAASSSRSGAGVARGRGEEDEQGKEEEGATLSPRDDDEDDLVISITGLGANSSSSVPLAARRAHVEGGGGDGGGGSGAAAGGAGASSSSASVIYSGWTGDSARGAFQAHGNRTDYDGIDGSGEGEEEEGEGGSGNSGSRGGDFVPSFRRMDAVLQSSAGDSTRYSRAESRAE